MREPKIFKSEIFINAPLDKVFDFFSKAENLEKITPPLVHFQFITPLPIHMEVGAIIDYKIRIHGVPVRWRTRIEEWVPGVKFVDVQVKGPFKYWHHTHEFRSAVSEGPTGTISGTMMNDTVRYLAPFGFLGELVTPIFVTPDVKKIFAHRSSIIPKFLGSVQE